MHTGKQLGKIISKEKENNENEKAQKEHNDLVRPKLVWFNGLLVAVLIVALALDIASSYVLFMMALALALVVNYPSMKMQDARIKAHAGGALIVAGTMLAAGAFVGVPGESGMLEAMTNVPLSLIPGFLGKYVHVIFGMIGLPLGMVIGVGESYGIAGINTAMAMLLGKNVSLLISPMVPATYLAIGFTDVSLKEHIKFSFPWLFGISILMVIAGIMMGIVAI